jgi:hypothetical protein
MLEYLQADFTGYSQSYMHLRVLSRLSVDEIVCCFEFSLILFSDTMETFSNLKNLFFRLNFFCLSGKKKRKKKKKKKTISLGNKPLPKLDISITKIKNNCQYYLESNSLCFFSFTFYFKGKTVYIKGKTVYFKGKKVSYVCLLN